MIGAFFYVFVPLFSLSGILSYWFIVKQPEQDSGQTSTRDFKAQLKSFKQAEKQRNNEGGHQSNLNPVQKKWLKFGGNFYGIVALYTYLLVELADLAKFFREFTSVQDFIARIDLHMLVNVLIEALINFITAITWPLYWLNTLDDNDSAIIWLAFAYLGYLAGMKAAMRFRNYQRQQCQEQE